MPIIYSFFVGVARPILIGMCQDAIDELGGGNAGRPLRRPKLAEFFRYAIGVADGRSVIVCVMCYVIDRESIKKRGINDPRRVLPDLVDPFAMADSFAALGVRHDSNTFLGVHIIVATDADNKVNIGKGFLGLFKHLCMPDMKKIKYTICINANCHYSNADVFVWFGYAHGFLQ